MIAMVTGADVTNVKQDDAGQILADILKEYMAVLMIPDGIQALGYQREDIPALVEGTLPQVLIIMSLINMDKILLTAKSIENITTSTSYWGHTKTTGEQFKNILNYTGVQ